MPHEYGDLYTKLRANVPGADRIVFSTHCQNDLGLATANTLAGAAPGAPHLPGHAACTWELWLLLCRDSRWLPAAQACAACLAALQGTAGAALPEGPHCQQRPHQLHGATRQAAVGSCWAGSGPQEGRPEHAAAGAMAGARQLECTINGIGERAGNSSLEEVVMAINKRGCACSIPPVCGLCSAVAAAGIWRGCPMGTANLAGSLCCPQASLVLAAPHQAAFARGTQLQMPADSP